jgi:hypothetical protein
LAAASLLDGEPMDAGFGGLHFKSSSRWFSA